MVSNIQIAGVGLACLVIVGAIGVFYFDLGIKKGSVDDFFSGFGTVESFELTQEGKNMKCEMFNEIWIESDGVESQVASFNERETVFIDSQFQNQLSLTANGKTVDQINVKLFLECKGKAMKGSTVVSGIVNIREALGSSPTVFFVGNDRPLSVFAPMTIPATSLQDKVKKEVFSYGITSQQIDSGLSTHGDGSKHFKSEMYPELRFDFNHPEVGVFSGLYNLVESDRIITQFSFSFVNDSTPEPPVDDPVDPFPDTDGDLILDIDDDCPLLPETINGFEDADGCPDVVPEEPGVDDVIACIEIFDPVCGDDGITYSNSCFAEVASVTNWFEGECVQESNSQGSGGGSSQGNTNPDTSEPGSETDDSSTPDTQDTQDDTQGILGLTTITPFANLADPSDPTGIIIIVVIFSGFIGAVIALNHFKKK